MSAWTKNHTVAYVLTGGALVAVDNMLTLAKGSPGKPSEEERALFAAAVVFIYGIWENFTEQLAIELAAHVSSDVKPERVPEQVRKSLEKKGAWELTVSPGWRTLWAESIKLQAVGDDAEKFGMNTARAGAVENLLVQAGVKEPYSKIPTTIIPKHLTGPIKSFTDAVDSLVTLRGEIVHTGKVPKSLRKQHVREWRKFIGDAAEIIDGSCREQCRVLLT